MGTGACLHARGTLYSSLTRRATCPTYTSGNAITGVLAPVMSDLIVAQGYDGSAQSYYPGGTQNTLATMDALHGYWLKLSSAANLTIPGTKVASNTPIPLQAGWNLIGYLPDTELAPEKRLFGPKCGGSACQRWGAGDGQLGFGFPLDSRPC